MDHDNNTVTKLKKLENLDDWKVHEDDTDIRGWKIYSNGIEVGEVENLIANTDTEKIHYIEVVLDKEVDKYRDNSVRNSFGSEFFDLFGKDEDRKTIIPIGLIEIDNTKKRVISSRNLTPIHFANSPRYTDFESTPVRPVNEVLIAKYYTNDDENYNKDYNNEEYNLEKYRSYPSIINKNFYNSDIFSRNSYTSRYRNAKPSTFGFKTGGA